MRVIVSIIVVAAIALAACGSDDSSASTTAGPATSAPAATTPATTSTPDPISTTAAPTTTAPTTTAPPEDLTVEISVGLYEGQVEGDQDAAVALGSQVRIVVAADVSDEVHVHGYDLFADVTPEADGVIEFTADVPGIFEVEMEAQGLELIRLEVS